MADAGRVRLPRNVYSLGRLDADSEGLLLLSDEPGLNSRLMDPKQAHHRTYWAQVEGIPDNSAIQQLAQGIDLEGKQTLPCQARLMDPAPDIPPRNPPSVSVNPSRIAGSNWFCGKGATGRSVK